jgi:CRP-like cAMP-binding protein
MQAVFTQIVRGMKVAGIADDEIERLTLALALDSFPKVRRNVIEFLAGQTGVVKFTAAELGDRVGLPTGTVNRALYELQAHGIVKRYSDQPNRWSSSDWLRDRWQAAVA